MVQWMSIAVQCGACSKNTTVVLGTKTKEEKPIAKCPECKSEKITILSVTPKSANA
jgi:hypothetical protein